MLRVSQIERETLHQHKGYNLLYCSGLEPNPQSQVCLYAHSERHYLPSLTRAFGGALQMVCSDPWSPRSPILEVLCVLLPRPQAHLLPFPAFSPLEPSHTQIASGPLHVRTPNQTESSDPPNRPWLERKGSGCVSGHAGCADSSRPDSLVLTSVVMVGLCSPAVCALTRHLAVDLVPVSPTEKTGGRTGQCGRLLPQPPPPLCTPC